MAGLHPCDGVLSRTAGTPFAPDAHTASPAMYPSHPPLEAVRKRTASLGMITEDCRGMTHMADIVETAARKVFDRYDVDGDGLVTAEEYRQVVAELEGSELTEAQARELIDSLDTDGDRKMSFDEFWAAMHG